jgi:two-component system cell cycle sensor histidine kinase PleC
MNPISPDLTVVLDAGAGVDRTRERPVSPRPVFTIDADLGRIIEGNAAGWSAWGLDGAAVKPPVSLDQAMPALRQLAALPCARVVRTQDALTLWTAAGVRRLRCAVRRMEQGRNVFAIEVLGDASDPCITANSARTSHQDEATRRLAHELRTPLSAVIAYAEVLKDQHFGPLGRAQYLEYARNIYDGARHALGVVEGMLASTPAAGGVPELIFADLDPRAVVENCLAVARPLAEQAGLELACDMGPRMPRIVADEVSLRQMLLNLLTNAIKFAGRGDCVTIGVTYELGGPLRIAVADTGPGMREPPLALEGGRGGSRPSLDASPPGHGIGLPLTRALAEANGAALVIDSAPGRGTRVTIAFGKDRVVPV